MAWLKIVNEWYSEIERDGSGMIVMAPRPV
jgi:hypothetical protein